MSKTLHISDTELQLATSEQQTETPTEKIENHIADCEQCQARLLELSADSTWRDKFTDELKNVFQFSVTTFGRSSSNSVDVGATPSGDEFDLHTVDQMLKEVLQSHTHPEMLGRLGRYEVESVLGCGGMGVVMRGFDRELHRPVAIKMVLPRLAINGTAKHRFLREARAAATVLHPNVIGIHDISESNGVPWFVMPLVVGPSLKSLVEQNGPLPEREIVRIGLQISSGLAAAHSKGLIHRDIKPENILVDNQVNRVVITDFGLARHESEEAMTQTGMVAGTLNYMSPEQSRGDDVDGRSDLFSLGGVLHFLATGTAPFQSSVAMRVLHKIRSDDHADVRTLNPEISCILSGAIDRLLAKPPAQRFQSASEVELFLNDYLAHLHHPTQKPAPIIPVARNENRSSSTFVGKLLLACAGVLCTGLFMSWIAGYWNSSTSSGFNSVSATRQWNSIKSRYQLGDDPDVYFSQLQTLGQEFAEIEKEIDSCEPRLGESVAVKSTPDDLDSEMLEFSRQIDAALRSFGDTQRPSAAPASMDPQELTITLQFERKLANESHGFVPLFKYEHSGQISYEGKERTVVLPAIDGDKEVAYGFLYFDGQPTGVLDREILFLVEDYDTTDPKSTPRFLVDLNNNLDLTDDDSALIHEAKPGEHLLTLHAAGQPNHQFTVRLGLLRDVPGVRKNPTLLDQYKKMFAGPLQKAGGVALEPRQWFMDQQLNVLSSSQKVGEYEFQIGLYDANCNGSYADPGEDYVLVGEYGAEYLPRSKSAGASVLGAETLIQVDEQTFEVLKVDPAGKFVRIVASDKPYLRLKDGARLPEYDLELLDGNSAKISAFLDSEKILLIDFWGNWCKGCITILPVLKNANTKWDEHLTILSLHKGDHDEARKIIEKEELDWIHAKATDVLIEDCMVDKWPYYVLVDGEGRIMRLNADISEALKLIETHVTKKQVDK